MVRYGTVRYRYRYSTVRYRIVMYRSTGSPELRTIHNPYVLYYCGIDVLYRYGSVWYGTVPYQYVIKET